MPLRSVTSALFAISCLLIAFQHTQAAPRDVHVFVIADKDDPDINDDVFADKRMVVETIEAGIAAASKYLKFHAASLHSRDQLLAQIAEKLQAERASYSRDDAIVVYFSGHGAVRDGEHGLLLNRGSDNEEFVPRSSVLRTMANFDPALSVLITDSCAKKNGNEFPDAVPTRFFTNPINPLMRRLFFEAHGVIDVNACQEGQSAWPSTEQTDDGNRIAGSLFTIAMTSTMKEHAKSKLTWEQFLPIVYEKTAALFKQHYPGGEEDEFTGAFQTTQEPVTYQAKVDYVGVSFGERLPLGVTLATCPHGIHITKVATDSPATRGWNANDNVQASLKESDHVLQVNRQPVMKYEDAVHLIRETKREIHLLIKDGQSGDAYVFVTELTDGPARVFAPRVPLGLHMLKCSKGVHIHALDSGSPGTRGRNVDTNRPARLKPGDHIVSINGVKVSTNDEALILASKANGRVTMRVRVQDTQEVYTYVTDLVAQ